MGGGKGIKGFSSCGNFFFDDFFLQFSPLTM